MTGFKIHPLYKTLDRLYHDDLRKVIDKDNGSNFDASFLGFMDIYEHLSKIIPKDWTIVDLGCCAMFQSYYFRNHKRYVGVDVCDNQFLPIKNTTFYRDKIDDFLGWFRVENKTFAICSYVPINYDKAKSKFNNLFIFYPEL